MRQRSAPRKHSTSKSLGTASSNNLVTYATTNKKESRNNFKFDEQEENVSLKQMLK